MGALKHTGLDTLGHTALGSLIINNRKHRAKSKITGVYLFSSAHMNLKGMWNSGELLGKTCEEFKWRK